MMVRQLPLIFTYKDSATFGSFHGIGNEATVAALDGLTADNRGYILCGPSSVGKSHLLQAVCHDCGERGVAAVYLSIKSIKKLGCGVLQGMEHLSVVCIDDLHQIVGSSSWESAMTDFLLRLRETRSTTVLTARVLPWDLGIHSPHLLSLLLDCFVLQLQPLPEQQLLSALALRANRRGLMLPNAILRYLLRHCGADMKRLCDAIVAIDQASLAQQRKLTIPFVRDVLKTF